MKKSLTAISMLLLAFALTGCLRPVTRPPTKMFRETPTAGIGVGLIEQLATQTAVAALPPRTQTALAEEGPANMGLIEQLATQTALAGSSNGTQRAVLAQTPLPEQVRLLTVILPDGSAVAFDRASFAAIPFQAIELNGDAVKVFGLLDVLSAAGAPDFQTITLVGNSTLILQRALLENVFLLINADGTIGLYNNPLVDDITTIVVK
jgi:hypothetical protein